MTEPPAGTLLPPSSSSPNVCTLLLDCCVIFWTADHPPVLAVSFTTLGKLFRGSVSPAWL
ncbi:hypothetical protein A2U01_0012097 [Trifolium medium]|uniref:Uncharacterized protein n=1 Tax=Trifolium medium TaxID=97028 RepID=A0A392MUL6_9FABA|nr:hypothetical protein [Trifolium medium]